MEKVICSNHGGPECSDCGHNKAHSRFTYHRGTKVIETTRLCTLKKFYCDCALEHMAGDMVMCGDYFDDVGGEA